MTQFTPERIAELRELYGSATNWDDMIGVSQYLDALNEIERLADLYRAAAAQLDETGAILAINRKAVHKLNDELAEAITSAEKAAALTAEVARLNSKVAEDFLLSKKLMSKIEGLQFDVARLMEALVQIQNAAMRGEFNQPWLIKVASAALSGAPFGGKITNAKAYDHALTAEEVLSKYL